MNQVKEGEKKKKTNKNKLQEVRTSHTSIASTKQTIS